jgi:hypothetical protein
MVTPPTGPGSIVSCDLERWSSNAQGDGEWPPHRGPDGLIHHWIGSIFVPTSI